MNPISNGFVCIHLLSQNIGPTKPSPTMWEGLGPNLDPQQFLIELASESTKGTQRWCFPHRQGWRSLSYPRLVPGPSHAHQLRNAGDGSPTALRKLQWPSHEVWELQGSRSRSMEGKEWNLGTQTCNESVPSIPAVWATWILRCCSGWNPSHLRLYKTAEYSA